MFKIEHRCTDEDSEPVPYSIQIGRRTVNGSLTELTRIVCPKCQEEFYVLGHDMFAGARPTVAGASSGASIPGFVIPRAGLGRN